MNITQHITATVALAGGQDVAIDTHGTGLGAGTSRDGSHLSVAYAGVILWFHDRRTVDRYASAWTTLILATLGRDLPAAATLTVQRTAHRPITLAVRAHHEDVIQRMRRPEALLITIGYVTWAVYDGDAFYEQVDLWSRVKTLSDLILPDAYLPAG